ncbi:hypothetical protein C9F11_00545 [Streptomyces sp. YIM 121038]|nr:hypothetical protein C9F11_00545 [Streptomyces sp. YIM 121038]
MGQWAVNAGSTAGLCGAGVRRDARVCGCCRAGPWRPGAARGGAGGGSGAGRGRGAPGAWPVGRAPGVPCAVLRRGAGRCCCRCCRMSFRGSGSCGCAGRCRRGLRVSSSCGRPGSVGTAFGPGGAVPGPSRAACPGTRSPSRGRGRVCGGSPVLLVVVLVCVMGWCGFVVGWWASLLVGAAGWRPGPLWRPGSPGWCLGFRGLRSGGPSCGLFGSCLWSWPAVSGWLPSLCCFGVWLCGVAVSGVLLLPRLCRCLPPGRDGAGWLDLPGGGGGGGGGGRGGGVGVGVGLGGVGGLVWGRGGGVK